MNFVHSLQIGLDPSRTSRTNNGLMPGSVALLVLYSKCYEFKPNRKRDGHQKMKGSCLCPLDFARRWVNLQFLVCPSLFPSKFGTLVAPYSPFHHPSHVSSGFRGKYPKPLKTFCTLREGTKCNICKFEIDEKRNC